MAAPGEGRLFRFLGAVVMLLLLAAAATFFSVVPRVWLRLFAGRPLDGASLAIRFAVALGAMGLVAGLMKWRRRL